MRARRAVTGAQDNSRRYSKIIGLATRSGAPARTPARNSDGTMTDFYDDEDAQADFFTATAARYERAAARFEERVAIALADVCIELRFASEALREIMLPAIRHLRIADDAECGLTIRLWDQATSGIPAPAPPFDKKRFTDRGDIWGFNSQRFRLAFHYGEFSVNLFDRRSGQGYYWVEDPARLPYWTHAAPLRSQLHWCMELHGRQLLHAAAVGTEAGAVLFTGRGGIGKSSTALTALLHGLDFAGDDYVVAALEPEPRVYPLYCSAKVNRDQLDRYAALRPWLRNPDGGPEEKAIFDLLPGHGARMPPSMPIRAVLVPEINGQPESAVTGDIHTDAIRHAASFTTVEQLPYAGRYTYDFIEALAHRVPGYKLSLGRDPDRLAATLRAHLADPRAPRARPGPAVGGEPPLVTVVIPAYNREHMLGEAIANVLEQGYPALDLIVVDDGSTDGTADVARSHPQARLFDQPNSGPAQARNRGIINARGDYIAFLDSDDLWPRGMLALLVQALDDDPETDVVMGWPQLARRLGPGEYEYEGNPVEGFPSYITGTVFRREVFSRVGLFDADLRFGEDNDWFERAGECGARIRRLDCASVIIRRHGGNMTHGKNLVQLNVLRVFKKALDRRRAGAPVPE